jgi:hypothetical protein
LGNELEAASAHARFPSTFTGAESAGLSALSHTRGESFTLRRRRPGPARLRPLKNPQGYARVGQEQPTIFQINCLFFFLIYAAKTSLERRYLSGRADR